MSRVLLCSPDRRTRPSRSAPDRSCRGRPRPGADRSSPARASGVAAPPSAAPPPAAPGRGRCLDAACRSLGVPPPRALCGTSACPTRIRRSREGAP
ncbi:hypothetical protein C5E16_02715 [Clavibacter michiganensis]|uniref:Uncharacterized protein n=1 Tax=Clavibacter michiganensis TaxID=28447 RepID=A0A2S5VWX1_9MICO|nr:hypothetical protein C5E16_02715 [Clavibacter michiganensis]